MNIDPSAIIPVNATQSLVRAKHGLFLANRNDFFIGRSLLEYGEHGEDEVQFLLQLLRPGATVVEVGANIGCMSVPMAKAIGPAGQMVLVEAQPVIHQILCANLALNGLHHVRAHCCGCGEQPGELFFPAFDYTQEGAQNFGGHALVEQAQGAGEAVAIVPLDSLIGHMKSLDVLKIDVEGMEEKVLRGAETGIKKHRPMLYLENDQRDKSQSLLEYIFALDYKIWWSPHFLYNPHNGFGNENNLYGGIISLNIFAVPQERDFNVQRMREITNTHFHPLKPDGSLSWE
jgi:FkbM family methyltransferase